MKCIVCNSTEIDHIRYDRRDGRELPCSICQEVIDESVSDFYVLEEDGSESLEDIVNATEVR